MSPKNSSFHSLLEMTDESAAWDKIPREFLDQSQREGQKAGTTLRRDSDTANG